MRTHTSTINDILLENDSVLSYSDGSSHPDASEGFFHGSMFIGSFRVASEYEFVITSRHGKVYSSTDLLGLVCEFTLYYESAWESMGQLAWAKVVHEPLSTFVELMGCSYSESRDLGDC